MRTYEIPSVRNQLKNSISKFYVIVRLSLEADWDRVGGRRIIAEFLSGVIERFRRLFLTLFSALFALSILHDKQ